MAVDDVEFREFFAAQYERLCWLGLLLTGDQAEAEVARLLGLPWARSSPWPTAAWPGCGTASAPPDLDPAGRAARETR